MCELVNTVSDHPLQRADGGLDGFRERLVVLTCQPQRLTERHADTPRPSHPPTDAKPLLQAIDADGDDGGVETRCDHADAGAERIDGATLGTVSLRKDQDRRAFAQQLADVPQGLPRAGLALWNGKRIEEERRQIVVETAGEPGGAAVFRGKEMRREQFL